MSGALQGRHQTLELQDEERGINSSLVKQEHIISTKSVTMEKDKQSEWSQTILSDSKISVSDTGDRGVAGYRAAELYSPERWDHFSKKTDVYALGIILNRLVADLEVSYELREAVKAATDCNLQGRTTLQ